VAAQPLRDPLTGPLASRKLLQQPEPEPSEGIFGGLFGDDEPPPPPTKPEPEPEPAPEPAPEPTAKPPDVIQVNPVESPLYAPGPDDSIVSKPHTPPTPKTSPPGPESSPDRQSVAGNKADNLAAPETKKEDKGQSGGVIAAIAIVGGLLLIAAVGIAAFMTYRRRQKAPSDDEVQVRCLLPCMCSNCQ
jgi:outer membrane biosynthesis protein TonB